jgi:hypothetical protein
VYSSRANARRVALLASSPAQVPDFSRGLLASERYHAGSLGMADPRTFGTLGRRKYWVNTVSSLPNRTRLLRATQEAAAPLPTALA